MSQLRITMDVPALAQPVARAYIELVKVLVENRALSAEDLVKLESRVPGLRMGLEP